MTSRSLQMPVMRPCSSTMTAPRPFSRRAATTSPRVVSGVTRTGRRRTMVPMGVAAISASVVVISASSDVDPGVVIAAGLVELGEDLDEVHHHQAGIENRGGPPVAIDDRNVAVLADRHPVDGIGDRVVRPQHL